MFDDFMMNHWAWGVLAVVLGVLELIMPGVFFIWLAVAALVTAVVAAIAPDLGWAIHLTIFGVLSVIAVVVGRRYVGTRDAPSQDESLNQRGRRLIGQVLTLIEPIENGSGRAKVGDGNWLVYGPDGLAKGARVRVIGVDGSALKVEATE